MTFHPSPTQVLLMWRMLFLGEEPMQSKTKPGLSAPERQELIDAGLVELERRGRAGHLMLTEKAWNWAERNLSAKISTRSPASSDVLAAVLNTLGDFLQVNSLSLSDFSLARGRKSPEKNAGLSPVETSPIGPEVEQRVREAYFKASHGKSEVRVRLWELRALLPEIPRERLDQALVAMMRKDHLALYPLDDPQDIKPEDVKAALNIAGEMNHILYFRG